MAFLRLLTNKVVMKESTETPARVWGVYRAMLSSSEAVWLPEPESIDMLWENLSRRCGHSGSEWTDAYLAAFAIGHGTRLVTFDRNFGRFEAAGLKVLLLKT